jgi:hypothetical protein
MTSLSSCDTANRSLRPTAATAPARQGGAAAASAAGLRFAAGRAEIVGRPSFHQVSDLGVVQASHGYDPDLLRRIRDRALALKRAYAQKRHLDLNFIRGAHLLIPEILDLVHAPGRLERLSALAGTPLEVYPLSVISSIVTFTSPAPDDGSIGWHADGIPVTELVPLAIEDLEGGELELYRGDFDHGLARVARGETIGDHEILRVRHAMGYSVCGQLMRLMHRVRPVTRGYRITLNLNLRAAEKPWLDDNSLTYLAADNPDMAWLDDYVDDVRTRVLPAYLKAQDTA